MTRPIRTLADAGPGELLPGHRARVLVDGRDAFPAMLRAIDAAQRSCWLETYILRDDRVGRTFARALAARAREGVATAVIYDAFGSLNTLSSAYLSFLRDAGVHVQSYHASYWRFWEWNQRDHRKILVVDGQVGFLGGLNIGDEYAAPEEGGGGWRDTHMQIEGPAVATLVELFASVWTRLTKEPPPGNDRERSEREEPGQPWRGPAGRYVPPAPVPGATLAKVVGTRRHGDRGRIKRAYLDAINAARRRIAITNAYFVPHIQIRRALAAAVKRGVDVRVITAGLSDVVPVQLAGRALYPGLLRGGVRVYERIERVLHAKTAVVDGMWATVGSYNLNRRSVFHDLEVIAVLLDEELGARLDHSFDHDLEESVEVDMDAVRARPLGERLLGAFFLRFASML